MRVLIVTQYFHPENFRINDLANELVNKGYHVDALVGIPNYPDGKYFKGYGVFKKRHEVINGINIYRCFQFPRGKKPGVVGLALNYLSFMFSACFWDLVFFSFKERYDAIIAYEPSPITIIIPAILLGKIKHTKVLSWIQDIWPDSITDSASKVQNKLLWTPLLRLTEFIYKNSDKLLVSSKGMSELICRNNNYTTKIEYIPNWADDFKICTRKYDTPMPSRGFNLLMAGTINDGIGIQAVCGFIKEISIYNDINIIFIGGGSRKDDLEQFVKDNCIKNAFILGRYPYEMMPSFYAKADAMFLSLANSEHKHLDVTVPSRLQSYMSAGKPIFAMIGSGAADIIKTNNCGFVVPAGEYKNLSTLVKNNYKNEQLLKQLGENARSAYEREFTLEVGVNRFIKLINSAN